MLTSLFSFGIYHILSKKVWYTYIIGCYSKSLFLESSG